MGSFVPRQRRRASIPFLIVVALLVLAVAYQRLTVPSRHPASIPAETPNPPAESPGDQPIEEAFRSHRSGVWVESSGTVERVLPDDRTGSPHQRFIVRLRDGRTLLVAHNIDLAQRAPVEPGSSIRFRGIYEWSDRGGTVHWTHHDPDRRQAGGWIEEGGRQYR